MTLTCKEVTKKSLAIKSLCEMWSWFYIILPLTERLNVMSSSAISLAGLALLVGYDLLILGLPSHLTYQKTLKVKGQ